MAITDPATKDPYELQRQRVDSQLNRQLDAKKKAIETQLAGKGISDSGIAMGAQRNAEVDARFGAATEKNQINANEASNEDAKKESAISRALQEKLANQSNETAIRGQDISKDLGQQGLNLQARGADLAEKSQADSLGLAKSGLGIQQAQLKLQEQGMSQNDAQYYAGLGQSKYLAEKGLTLQEQAQELQKQGMSQQDAQFYAGLNQQGTLENRKIDLTAEQMAQNKEQFYAGLNQANQLAQAGLGLEAQKVELQKQGMDQNDAQFYAGLSQSKTLAEKGLDLQAQAQELQKQGMTQQNAQFYAGLAQSNSLAQQGFTIDGMKMALQQEGMNQQDSQYYAGLAQAKQLADKGLDQQAVSLELQKQGLDQNEANAKANLAFNYDQLKQQKELTNTAITSDIQKGIIVDQMSKIDPKDPNYLNKIGTLLNQFTGIGEVFNAGVPAAATTPQQDQTSAIQSAIKSLMQSMNLNKIS